MTDLITMQVIRYALEQIADEMGHTLVRTGRSTIITEIKDISCVVTDAKGQTVAQAHHTPSLLAGFEITMRELVKTYRPADLAPGDVIVTNDPYRGCQHIMDLYAIAPAFHDGELVGFVGNITHHTDLGGVAAGGVAGGIREIYLEGLRLPMVKLLKRGVEDREILGIIANQIRIPEKTLGDIRAQVSSLMVGVDRVDRLFRKYGKDTVQAACADLLDYSERRMRQGLMTIPSGVYRGEDFIDDDGINDRPIRIAVKLTIDGGRAVVDLTESDPQAEGNTNSTIANTFAAAYYVMIAVVDPHMPPNSGCYRPIEVLTKPGTVVDPLPPGAVAARTNCSQKIVEALLRALAPAVPERVPACGHAQITTCAFGGFDPDTKQPPAALHEYAGGSGRAALSDPHRALRAGGRQRRRRKIPRQPRLASRHPGADRPGELRPLCRSPHHRAARSVRRPRWHDGQVRAQPRQQSRAAVEIQRPRYIASGRSGAADAARRRRLWRSARAQPRCARPRPDGRQGHAGRRRSAL
jgi:N-methylhydantoinase B